METPKENWDIFKPHAGSTETETMGKSLIKSDNTQTLQNALEQIEKLEADKAELLEALYFAKRHCKKPAPVLFDKIESLIQKNK